MVAPMIHLLAVSFSSTEFVNAKQVYFWPRGLNFQVYDSIFQQKKLWKSLGVSVYITALGTLIALFFTSTIAYALSRPQMPARKLILRAVVLTFVFSVPLIPSYLLVRTLQMDNTLWALMIPGALGAFNIIIMKTFFQGLSAELFDAAQMDGCSEYGIFARIAIPLSMPVIATIALFHAVGQWNSYFSALIYIRTKDMYPLQVLLRNMVMEGQVQDSMSASEMASSFTPEQMKAGVVLFATLPIVVVYPLLQRHFVKGAMLGSLKE
ncbi:carbohydrate ABC transporter permease [Paenibacillus hemerocallicola]|uniref:Carbohydrate ABC transporter permease n=2 Tax=Paenibacillus hemerocallicola TaxID=1172614 RepID=A0A5C4T631_9BACL|nr:carbohydrate ABC transporter permease [Paenibacillus hemerocallicola]